MDDVFWLGAAAVAVAAGVAVAGLVHLADRRALEARKAKWRRQVERSWWLNRSKIPVQLVRDHPPLEERKVVGRIGPAGRAR